MQNVIKAFLFAVVLTGLIVAVFPVAAQIAPISGADCTTLGIQCTGNEDQSSVISFITNLVNIVLGLVGIIAAIFIVIGGIRLIISQGDSDDYEKAKKTVLYAVLGLVLIGIAAVLVNFTINAISGRAGGAGGNPGANP